MNKNFDELSGIMVYEGDGRFRLTETTRFEIYPQSGSVRHVLTLGAGADLCIQDGGRTVKLFVGQEVNTRTWFEKQHDLSRANQEKLHKPEQGNSQE